MTPSLPGAGPTEAIAPAPARPRRALPSLAPLIGTKLETPALPPAYRERARLSRRLDGAIEDRRRLTIVVAPPGYGKTLAVAGWLRSSGVAHAWLSLDAADDDLVRFIRYLAAALERVRPAAAGAAGLLGPGPSPAPDLVAATLLEAIGADDEPFVLLLDDYHAVRSAPVHALLRVLVERAPPFCHVVVLGREDPPLPLARLRAHRRLLEVRADELRYSEPEAAEYLARAGLELPPKALGRLVERTEGWVAGLQLAALSLARSDAPAAAVEAFGGSQRFVLDYLADEVLDRLEPDLRDFLVRTSVADRFTAGLCAALTGRDDTAALLDRAERESLFVVPLDLERRWYRYHHLFAGYLRSLLGDAERRDLHERAANWLESAGLPDEAIAHLLEAGATERAAGLVERAARRTFEAGELATLLGWFEALPAALVERGELGAWRAWALFYGGQLGAADAAAARQIAAAAEPGAAEGRLLVLRALLQTVLGPQAEQMARDGLELVGDDPFFRSSALQAIGLAMHARGDLAGAVECLSDAFAIARRVGPVAAFGGLTPVAQALNAVGRRNEAEALCREVLAEFGATGSAAMTWFVDVVLGLLRYEANDVAEARRLLDRGFEAAGRLRTGRTMVEWGIAYLALARRADGSPDAALDALRVAARDVHASGLRIPIPIAETEARIRLLEGDLAAAARWADGVEAAQRTQGEAAGTGEDGSPLGRMLRVSDEVTLARIRLAQRRPAEAWPPLRRAEHTYRAWGAVAELISVHALEAAAAETSGRRSEAVRLLEQAVTLGARGGYVRRLVEDGALVAHLLPSVRRLAPDFVDEVAQATAAGPPGRSSASVWPRDGQLLEALTPRELDVLRLVAGGARNAEVAASLGMSVGTARWHVGNVLAKLGVASRTQATLRAQQLGLV